MRRFINKTATKDRFVKYQLAYTNLINILMRHMQQDIEFMMSQSPPETKLRLIVYMELLKLVSVYRLHNSIAI